MKQVPSFDFTWNWTLNYWIAVVFSYTVFSYKHWWSKRNGIPFRGGKTEGNRGSQFLFYREWNQEILPHINGLKNRWLNMKFHLVKITNRISKNVTRQNWQKENKESGKMIWFKFLSFHNYHLKLTKQKLEEQDFKI